MNRMDKKELETRLGKLQEKIDKVLELNGVVWNEEKNEYE
jgi:hypothetical protein